MHVILCVSGPKRVGNHFTWNTWFRMTCNVKWIPGDRDTWLLWSHPRQGTHCELLTQTLSLCILSAFCCILTTHQQFQPVSAVHLDQGPPVMVCWMSVQLCLPIQCCWVVLGHFQGPMWQKGRKTLNGFCDVLECSAECTRDTATQSTKITKLETDKHCAHFHWVGFCVDILVKAVHGIRRHLSRKQQSNHRTSIKDRFRFWRVLAILVH